MIAFGHDFRRVPFRADRRSVLCPIAAGAVRLFFVKHAENMCGRLVGVVESVRYFGIEIEAIALREFEFLTIVIQRDTPAQYDKKLFALVGS